MTKVVLINGPARSGKDTLAKEAKNHFLSAYEFKFADVMHNFWQDVFFSMHDYDEAMSRTDGDLKSDPSPVLGLSYRQCMIATSEDFIKPILGNDFFGRLTAAQIAKGEALEKELYRSDPNFQYVALVSDSGFKEEAVAVIEKFGSENVLLLHLYRNGYTYSGDSRGYIHLDEFGVKTVNLENITLEQFTREGVQIIRDFVEA